MCQENKLFNKSEYLEFGHNLYGPFLRHFNTWLANECKKREISKIYFCSRDAYAYKEAFNYMNIKNIEIDYIYMSKKSLIKPLLATDLSNIEILYFVFSNRVLSVEELLIQLGMNEDEIDEFAKEMNLNRDLLLYRDSYNKEIIDIIGAFRKKNIKIANEQLNNLKKYLEQIGFEGYLALVDVGWRGSIQFALNKILKYINKNIQLEGFYVGINRCKNIPINNYHGFMFEDNDKCKAYYQIMSSVAIFEMLGMEHCGTVLEYRKINQNIEPRLNTYEYIVEKDFSKEDIEIKYIQEGALQYVKKSLFVNEKYDKELFDILANPDKSIVKMFGDWRCSNCILRNIIFINKPYFFKLRKCIKDFNISYWKAGFLFELFPVKKSTLSLYIILKLLFDNRRKG